MVFSPDGRQIASGSNDNTVRLWDAQTGAPGAILSGHTDSVYSVVFSPNGLQIASGSEDRTVRLWDAQTIATGAILIGHTGSVHSVVFSTNNQLIASGSSDNTVRLWDVESGQCLTVIKDFNGTVVSLAWITKGGDNYFASGCNDAFVGVWRVAVDRHSVYLQWSSGPGHLALTDATVSNTRGLSRMSTTLLEQRGALGSPIMLDNAADDD